LATLINGALLLFIAIQILSEAIQRILHPEEINFRLMLPVAAVGLLANAISVALLRRHQYHLATRSAYLHVLSDLVSSIGVVLSALIIRSSGFVLFDPLMSIFIAGLILLGAKRLLKESVHVLMEASPAHLDLEEVKKTILAVHGVEGLHDLHVWTISSGFLAASAHIQIYPMDTRSSDQIVQKVSATLKEVFAITHTTLQIEALQAPATIERLSTS
jgi:cobalt-zinc-cadmium efflux system protein